MATQDFFSDFMKTVGLEKLSVEGLGSIGTLLLWFFGSVVFAIIFGLALYLIVKKVTFNQTIKIFGLVGNIPSEKFRLKGRFVRIGRAGDRVLESRKPGLFNFKPFKTLPNPTLQMGPNEWWFWERLDGEWINIGLEDFDAKMKALNIKYIDSDMRMERLAIEKNLRERMQEKSFWAKYGALMFNIGFIIILTLMIVVIFSQFAKIGPSISGAMEELAKVTEDLRVLRGVSPQRPQNGGTIPSLLPLILIKFLWGKKCLPHLQA